MYAIVGSLRCRLWLTKLFYSKIKLVFVKIAIFPNHEVEVQVEFQATPKPRKLYWFKPPDILRNKESSPTTTKTTTKATTTKVTTTKATTTKATTTKATTTPVTDAKRKIVYEDDLDKVIEAIEKKIAEIASKLQPNEAIPGFENTEITNLNKIIALLHKKGVQIRKDAPKPTDDNLQWIQFKIPKE